MPTRAALFALLLLAAPLLAAQAADDWRVEIVPSQITTQKISRVGPDEFFVILTNLTDHGLTIWREWCSWGYSCVTFTVTRPDGRTFELERYGTWLWNTPDATFVPPGQHCVYTIAFDHQNWEEGFPKDFHTEDVTIQAHYKVDATDPFGNDSQSLGKPNLAPKAKVWTGQASSPPIKVTLAKPDTKKYQ